MSNIAEYTQFPFFDLLKKTNFGESKKHNIYLKKLLLKIDSSHHIKCDISDNDFNFELSINRFSNKKSVIIICSKDNAQILEYSLSKLKEFKLNIDHDILLVDDRSASDSVYSLAEKFNTSYLRINNSTNIFNYSILNNIAACYTIHYGKELLIFYNDDMWPSHHDSLSRILNLHQTHSADITGVKLVYPSKTQYEELGKPYHLLETNLDYIYDTIQHGGIFFSASPSLFIDQNRTFLNPSISLKPFHTWRFYRKDYQLASVNMRCYAVTGALHIIKSSTFMDLNGFNIGMGCSFQDIDICLRAIEFNKTILYVGSEYMYHAESITNAKEKITQQPEYISDNILWDLVWSVKIPHILGFKYDARISGR